MNTTPAPPIPPWAQRVLTVAAGAGIALLSLAIPPAAAYLVPLGVGLAGTVIPHPAEWWRQPPRRN